MGWRIYTVIFLLIGKREPIELFLVPASVPLLVQQTRGVCYPVCGMMYIKKPLLLIEKSILCGGSGFSLSLSELSFTIILCLTLYNRKNRTNVSINIIYLPF